MSEIHSVHDGTLNQSGDGSSGPASLTPLQKKANTKAIVSFALFVVSLVLLLFPPLSLATTLVGYFLAKQAERDNGKNAKVAKILNAIVFWIGFLGSSFFFALSLTVGG